MKALVTGAAGFLGFHLARRLSSLSGWQVVCVDNFSRGLNDEHYGELLSRPNVSGFSCDLTKHEDVEALPADFDYVFHLAALNGTQNFYERPVEVIRSSTLPTILLAEKYFRSSSPPKRFVYAGTSESYASSITHFGWPIPTSEEVPLGISDVLNPRWSYAASKTHGEVVTAQYGLSSGVPFTIARFHNAYGPRMGDKHVIPDFFERAKNGVFQLFGYEDTRSFMYVDDAVEATIRVATLNTCENEIINIGGETEISILELSGHMLAVRNLKGEVSLFDSPSGSVRRRLPDVTKLRRLTGFDEQIDLKTGLEATASFYFDGVLVGWLRRDTFRRERAQGG